MIRCLGCRPCQRNTLRAFVDLQFTRLGLVIKDCTWHVHENGREWVSFPARSYKNALGKTQWVSILEFAVSATAARKAFQEQALRAIHEVADTEKEPVS